MVINQFGKIVDRNRRGIIVLLRTKNSYYLAVENYTCFSSENEDGGVYYPPELSVGIDKGKLIIGYAHGRYGFWEYKFRLQNNEFKLIGYDESNHYGPILKKQTSINFLSKKKLVRVNTNEDAEAGDDVFKDT